MRLKPLVTALCAGALLAAAPFAQAKELKSIGVTVGDLANPFFVQITKGAELEARKLAGDNVKVTLVSSGYDLGQQVSQIDNFIAANVDMIILNAADSKGIGPAVKRAKDAGIVVVAVDYSAAIFLIPICISFDTAEKRRYATYLILNRRFSFEF